MKRILIILHLLLVCNLCFGQQGKPEAGRYDFVARETVVFEDDFSHDNNGAFPSRWHNAICKHYQAPTQPEWPCCEVLNEGREHSLLIKRTARYIEPNINAKYYLHDSFTVEFEVAFDSSGCAELCFYPNENKDSCVKAILHLLSNGMVRISDFPLNTENRYLGSYPTSFRTKEWHHFALDYKQRAIDVYIDKYRIASLPDCKFSPYALSLGCIAPVRYRHFKITAGKQKNPFAAMLTEKKLVTHAINFDVNSSAIKPESVNYIVQLAQFLKANPLIKLEIDGHTDSDGDSTANSKLSQARADEVKKKLVALGINGNTLTTKGFGATRPLQPNTTPAGKANNRRVEFINTAKH